MCVVSNTGDYWGKRLTPWQPFIYPPITTDTAVTKITISPKGPTQEDFDNLAKEVQIMKEQLASAKEYDRKNNEPDCEIEEKMAILRAIAKLVNIDLDEVLSKKSV